MISTAYPYPVDDNKPTTRRPALRPRIYSPSESHSLPRNIMYPHPNVSVSPPPHYVYSGYEQYYSKGGWVHSAPSSWSTLYHLPLSSSLPETAINPKVTILPPQSIIVSDIDTPSSVSSHSVLTPSSPFARHDVDETKFQSMEYDEFDCDDDEDYIDSDFADEMEGIDETDVEHTLVYGASAPHFVKSTSALEGALGDTQSSSCNTDFGLTSPADRRLSASVPGYPSASNRSTAISHQRMTSSSPVPEVSYPSQHTYTPRNTSSMSTQTSSDALYHRMPPSSSLAGAFTSSVPSLYALRSTTHPLPILQPQPIRPIPPIPLAELTCSADDGSAPDPCAQLSYPSLRTLSPLPLLCQPVSDAVRYQLKERPSSGGLDDVCYAQENTSDSMCEDIITASESHRFTRDGLTFCPAHSSTDGSCSVGEKIYPRGCVDLPIRWQ